jgi:hypothetical protein
MRRRTLGNITTSPLVPKRTVCRSPCIFPSGLALYSLPFLLWDIEYSAISKVLPLQIFKIPWEYPVMSKPAKQTRKRRLPYPSWQRLHPDLKKHTKTEKNPTTHSIGGTYYITIFSRQDNMNLLDLSNQNSSDNIRRLAAQKQLYFDGKRLFLWQFALSVPVTILLALSKVLLSAFFKVEIAWLTTAFGAILSVFEFFVLAGGISSRRTNAARIQEAFDTSLYGMPWNEITVGSHPQTETVNRYYRKFKQRDTTGEKMTKLVDWYPIEASGAPQFKGILICQKANVHYDFSLRERFLFMIRASAITTFLLLFVFSLIENITIRSMLSQVLLPFLPILTITFKLTQEHNKSIKNLTELRQHLDKQVAHADVENTLSMDILRRLQDMIFLNRKDSPLIPEQFYDRLRNTLENEMHDNAASLK